MNKINQTIRKVHDGQRGWTLLEIVITLGIACLLMTFVVMAATGVYTTARITSAQESVNQMYAAALSCWVARGKTSYTGISIEELVNDGCLPSSFTGNGNNPWGGDFSISVNASDPSKVDISLTGVPNDAGEELRKQFARKASAANYDAAGRALTVTF